MNKAEELIESIVQPLDEIKVLKSVSSGALWVTTLLSAKGSSMTSG